MPPVSDWRFGEVQRICFGHPKLNTGISIELEACDFLLIVIAL